ncbi:MOLPALP family lipoprotein [Mesoplasma seiffertii]|uniref:MOLPALP family lipoprotein n=1 Tax=Mesoplasma seiffertii TaxID=28224 RepID=UPI00047BE932|nr:MOLPALP family lipoprotein [Mesoplasma seiffertii]
MKKFLSVLGALTIGVSASTTVAACLPKKSQQDDKNNVRKPKEKVFNNSLNNLQGTAALMAKKVILGDQYQYSSKVLNSMFNHLKAKDSINQLNENDKPYNENDFALDEQATFGDLSFRYFGNDMSFKKTELSSNIKLNGRKGTSNELLTKFIPEQGFLGIDGETIAEAIDMIIKLIPSISTNMITNILKGFGAGIDFSILENKVGKQNLKYISQAVKLIFTNQNIVKSINQGITKMDVIRESYDLSLANMTGAMFISIANGVSLIKNPQFVPLATNTDADVKTNLSKAAESLYLGIQPLDSDSKLISSKPKLTLDNTLNYIKAGQEFVKGLQFFQMQFSLFDKTKSVNPKNGQNLFDDKLNNKTFYKNLFKGKVGDKFAAANFNFKYLLTTFKYYLGAIGNQNDPEGRRLQKFLFILFGDASQVTEKFEFDWSETGNTVRHQWNFSSKNGSNGANFGYYLLQNFLIGKGATTAESIWKGLTSIKTPVIGALSKISLQDFKGLIKSDQFYYLICNFFYAFSNDEGVSDGFKGPLNQTLKKLFNKTVVGITNFPKYLTKNLFSSLYAKDFRSEFSINIGSIVTINIWDKLDDATKKAVNDFLGGADVPMNLQSVLKKPLSSLLNKTPDELPDELLKFYTKKTIPEIIDSLANDFEIDDKQDLESLQSYGIYIDDVSKLINDYLINNEWVDEYGNSHRGNIISQLLDNLKDTLRIIGITSFGVRDNSLWDFLCKHFFVPDHQEHEVRNGINLTLNGKRVYVDNKQELTKTLSDIYISSAKNKITLFSNKPKIANGNILTQAQINQAGNVIEDWSTLLNTSNKEFWVVNQYRQNPSQDQDNKYVITEVEKIALERVKMDNSKQSEVTDHLQEIFQVLNRIYSHINVVKDYKQEIMQRFNAENQYQWTFSEPQLLDNEIIIGQTLKVVYTNLETQSHVTYEFKYSRSQGTMPFKFDSIAKIA